LGSAGGVTGRAIKALTAYRTHALARLTRLRDLSSQQAATALYRAADVMAAWPFRDERSADPSPIVVDGRPVDVADDLEAYTGLDRDVVVDALRTRRAVNFRGEWHATPEALRRDRWFYLSAKSYLFANAIHFPDSGLVDEHVLAHVEPPGPVLDFGAGTGELALRLAQAGYRVSVSEINALQRDFMRFRVDRHGLERRIAVLDPWEPIADGDFAAVTAIDVLEHLRDAQAVLAEQLLPALNPEGVLIENSPFVVNVANPMHHADFGFVPFMRRMGWISLADASDGTRVWQRDQIKSEGDPG
jgi:methyltransferase family protein